MGTWEAYARLGCSYYIYNATYHRKLGGTLRNAYNTNWKMGTRSKTRGF